MKLFFSKLLLFLIELKSFSLKSLCKYWSSCHFSPSIKIIFRYYFSIKLSFNFIFTWKWNSLYSVFYFEINQPVFMFLPIRFKKVIKTINPNSITLFIFKLICNLKSEILLRNWLLLNNASKVEIEQFRPKNIPIKTKNLLFRCHRKLWRCVIKSWTLNDCNKIIIKIILILQWIKQYVLQTLILFDFSHWNS